MGRPERPIDPGAGPVPEFAVELRKLREEAGRPSYRELARRAHFSVTVLAEAAGGRCLPTLAVVRGYVAACGGDVAEWEERWRLTAARHGTKQQVPRQAPAEVENAAPAQNAQHAQNAQNAQPVRSVPRPWWQGVVLVVVLTITGVGGGVTVWQHESSIAAGNAAMSGQLAAQSARFATVNSDAAALAALAAWQAAPTVTARSALLSLTACCTSTQASLNGESATVSAVALSPGGKLLAAGGDDHAVHLWDTATGRQLAVLGGFAGRVRSIAFSPDGTVLAAGSDDDTIRLWNPATRTETAVLRGAAGAIEDLAFGPDATLLASASADGEVRLWNPVSRQLERVLASGGKATSVAFSPDGQTLAAAGDNHTVTLWNTANIAQPSLIEYLTGATEVITNLAYSPDGTMVAAEETGGDVLLWNPRQHEPMLLRHAAGNSHGLAFSRDGTVLITAGSYEDLLLWNTGTARLAGSTPRRIPGNANALAYDPASGSLAMGGPAGAVQFWRAPIPPFTGSTGPVTGLATVPGSTMIATVSGDGMLRLWNGSGSPVSTTRLTARPAAIAVSPGGKLLAAIGRDGALTLRGIPGLSATLSVRTVAPAADAVFSPDGAMVATAAGYTVAVRNTGSAAPLRHFFSRHGYFKAVAFSPDGRTVAAATTRGSVMLWDVRTGRRIAEVDPATGPVNAVAFSPDGQTLATAGDDGDITFWSPAGLRRRVTLPGPVGSVQALAFSPDGKILASAGHNGTIMLWDTASLALTATLTSNDGPVNALAFAPGGRSLISGDNRNRIVVWDLSPAGMARQACRMLAGDPGLSQAETLVPNASYPRLCPSR
jgi:WD40 repeat protein